MADLELLEEASAALPEAKVLVAIKIIRQLSLVSHFFVAFQEARTSRQEGPLAFW
jgi:hypothetical protein